jgi:tRNA-specific 2-thiouridylase
MSGGVDSSVAAWLLQREGHEVVGVTLKLQECRTSGPSRSCCDADGIARARAVADGLGIPHYVVSCVREFDEQVLRPAWDEYAAGRTPSPCLLCNERIKFGFLLRWARGIGASAVATGHYARIETRAGGSVDLLRASDRTKDQSYFLAGLTQDQLGSSIFPVGRLPKREVRRLAEEVGLPTAGTGESQDACLVRPGQRFAEMLRLRFGAPGRPGRIVNGAGRVLTTHHGIHLYTVGQRSGLGAGSAGRRWVTAIRAADAAVVVTDDERELQCSRITASAMSWVEPPSGAGPARCEVQVRHRAAPVPARAEIADGGETLISCERPVRAPAPGQAAVLYEADRVLGRGWIGTAG